VARRVKKTAVSLSYSLQRLYTKISTAKPSAFAIAVIIMAVAVFLYGGGLHLIIMKPIPAAYYGGRFLFVYPQLSEQWVSDSLIAMILFTMGVSGALFIYQSTKYAYKPRQAYLTFIIGAVLLFVAYISLEAVLHYWKGV
jgi:predicted neutral ceramidase superfamily lipid hydrolase